MIEEVLTSLKIDGPFPSYFIFCHEKSQPFCLLSFQILLSSVRKKTRCNTTAPHVNSILKNHLLSFHLLLML